MPIERDFLEGEGLLPILFHVHEEYEVWDGQVALLLDHLLNHVKVLISLAEGPADQSVLDALAQHPGYELRQKHILSADQQASLTDSLIGECLELLNCLVRIAPILQIDKSTRNRLLEATRDRIPFLDYHYVDEEYVSDAWRED